MKEQHPLDLERTRALVEPILELIRDNYELGPVSRDRCLEALNALAICSAAVIQGTGARDEALEWFSEALNNNLGS